MSLQKRILFFLLFLPLFLVVLPNFSFAEATPSTENIAPEQVDSVLAKLSDEQVRELLITELSKNMANGSASQGKGSLVKQAVAWLHVLEDKKTGKHTAGFFASIGQLPADLISTMRTVGDGSIGGFLLVIVLLCLIFSLASLLEFFVRRLTADFRKQFQEKAIPDLDGPMRFVAGLMRSIPALIHILVFSTATVLFYFLLPFKDQAPAQYLFLTILIPLIFFRSLTQVSRIICAPELPRLRIIPADDTTAKAIHRGVVFICSYTFAAVFVIAMFKELQLGRNSLTLIVIALTSILIALILSGIMRSRTAIKDRILRQSEIHQTRNWIVEQFAQFWHMPTMLYFIIIWLIMVSDQLAGVHRQNAAFLMSLLVLPLFVIFDAVGQWVVRASINSLRLTTPLPEDNADEELEKGHAESLERERKIIVTSGRLVRLSILASLLVWVLSLWGYDIPYATEITGAIFESLVTMALGLTAWRFASSYIERKILEDTPQKEEEKKDNDDEFGSAVQMGRSYTLLPMIRKFIATTLLVMVTLIILSSFGVDIGPLLAGAGVIGLAIGFGAQKMVSDVFSGFFYLLDDAFRVGEYIKGGSVSGAVEAITLRNVMLRHHRGMLQIVPHSELGSITNFMRGGIVVKFNLEFPYDSDVDKIRKVIKKVGQAMLKDEEFGEDFIRPVKSAGVREITGSVMVIRVKFTAHPGTQFVIRREAYKRITESLATQGIHYAHRKVIVELPEDQSKPLTDEMKRILEAGAAAELAQQEEDKKQQGDGQKSGGTGMPGM